MQAAKDVIVDFGTGTRRNMVAYDDGIFIDTAIFMISLMEYLKPIAKFVTKKVNHFKETMLSILNPQAKSRSPILQRLLIYFLSIQIFNPRGTPCR